jgi:hypothetical protein
MLSATGGGVDRAPQRLAVAHQLIEIRCAARDLGNGSVADCRTEDGDIHLLEEVAEGGI